jgi:acetyl esterase/lipase
MPARPSGGGPGAVSGPAATYADVPYATVSASQALDIWIPTTGSGPFPLVIFIHGGAFQGGDKAMEGGNVAAVLDAGYAAASLNYRLSGEALFPAAVQDVKAAVRFLRANAGEYGLDPDRFAAWGESAGGNLVSLLGTTGDQATIFDDPALGNADTSSAVQAVVDWYGPTDFLQMDAQFAAATPAACNGQTQAHDPADSPESSTSAQPSRRCRMPLRRPTPSRTSPPRSPCPPSPSPMATRTASSRTTSRRSSRTRCRPPGRPRPSPS